MVQAVEELQTAFQSLQASLYGLKVVLNVQKTKFMTFTRARTLPEKASIVTSGGLSIEKCHPTNIQVFGWMTSCPLKLMWIIL